MTVYLKAVLSKEEFGEILAEYIQKSRAIEIEHTINVHLIDENDTEISTIDTDDIYGLICAIGAVIRRFEPGIIQQYEGLDEYGLDIYDKRNGKMIFQIDRNIHKEGIDDVRFNTEVFKEYGYEPTVLVMVKNFMISMYD